MVFGVIFIGAKPHPGNAVCETAAPFASVIAFCAIAVVPANAETTPLSDCPVD